MRHGNVSYRKIPGLAEQQPVETEIPFTKRWPYRIESEYRILFESQDPAHATLEELPVPIDTDCIRRITVSQSMPQTVFNSIKSQIGPGLGKRICRSTLYRNETWIKTLGRQG